MPASTSPRSPALPGFSAPAAGFDKPLDMLHACHERVWRSLDLLARIVQRVEQGRVDRAVSEAAADVLRYFDQAAPHHHEDEEQHIFPRLLKHGSDPALRKVVLRLQEDHLAMETEWARLRTPLAALAAGHAEGFDRAHIEASERFRQIYAEHTPLEEELVFPAAAALLDERDLQAMGQEMAARRGVRPMPPRG